MCPKTQHPAAHAGRPRRTAREFAAHFFGDSAVQLAAAAAVFEGLQQASPYDLSGVEPDDPLASLLPAPDPRHEVDAILHTLRLDPLAEPEKRQAAQRLVEQRFWLSLLHQLLGPASSACTWDAATLPHRNVGALVQQRALHSPAAQGPAASADPPDPR
jgi:hypothetical protein